ncbi:hypothetical protein BDV06DRAFT_235013 [Aspergillus oleicola]
MPSVLTFALLLCLFPFSICREPLINSNGRFAYIDNIQTITVNTTIQSSLLRRDTNPYLNCRGTCQRRSSEPLTRRLKSRNVPRASPYRREFVYPADNELMATYLVDRVDNWEEYGGFPVYTYELNPGNSAEYAVLGTNPVEIVLDGLCGCTVLLVVSQKAVYFAHFFESLSFLSRDFSNAGSRAQFEQMVINFLQTGDDMLGEILDENGIPLVHSYDALTDNLHHFPPDSNPAIYIITPRNELSDAQAAGTKVTGIVDYGEGLLYEGYIMRLREYLHEILPHIQPQIFDYEALDSSDDALDGHRGKGLYQYDPAAVEVPWTGEVVRGARFFYQANDIPDPLEEGVIYPGGRLYEDYWTPPLFAEGEDRDLDDTVQRPPVTEPLLVCGEQPYMELKASYVPFSRAFQHFLAGPIATSSRSTLASRRTNCALFSVTVKRSRAAKTATSHQSTSKSPSRMGKIILANCLSCENVTLTPVRDQVPDQIPGQSGVTPAPIPSPTITTPPWDFVLDGTTYIARPSPTTIVDQDGETIVLNSDSIVIGTETIWTSETGSPSSTTIIDNGLTITILPHPTWIPTPTGTGTSTGDPPTTSLPPSTTSNTGSSFPTILPASTVLTITATAGSRTLEITFTPTTLAQFTSLSTSTTMTTVVDGTATTLVVGPGGLAWDPVSALTALPDFPTSIPYPTAAPTAAPAPGPSPTIPTPTSSTYSTSIFPFPFPTVTTITSTIDSPDGPSVTTITGTTDSDASVIPITTLSPEEVIGSAQALLSDLSSVSGAVAALSSNPNDPPSATVAVDAIEAAQADTNDFGSGLSISGPSLWDIFGSSLSGIALTLKDLLSAVSRVVSDGGGGSSGSSSSSSLSGPLNALSPLMSSLSADIAEAQNGVTPPTTSAPPPEPPSTTSTPSPPPPPPCTPTLQTNCIILCATDGNTAPTTATTTTCFSTTCSIETACDGLPATSTSTAIMEHVCPTDAPSWLGNVKQYWYEGLTRPAFNSRPTFTSDSGSSSTSSSSTETSAESTSTSTISSVTSSTETIVPTTTATSTEPPPPPPSSSSSEPTSSAPTSVPDTTTTTSTVPDPAPTWGGRCATYEDCSRCADGYYRCCLSGCHGMLVPESGTCGCVKDGEIVSPVCGCL